MRLLILDQFSDPGGAQQCLRDLVPEMLRRNWHLTFMAPGNGPLHADMNKLGLRCRTLPGGGYGNGEKTLADAVRYCLDLSASAARVYCLTRQPAPDVVYVNGPRLLPLAVLLNRPVVYHAHSRLNKSYARFIVRKCLLTQRVDVIATSAFVAQTLRALSASLRMKVIYPGVPDQGFPIHEGRSMSRIGIVGRIAPEKGHLDFVRAAALLSDRRLDVEFAVFGSSMISAKGYEERVRTEADGRPIRFMGWTNDVASVLHKLDVLTVPSNANEAAGRVVIEALSAGTPVVAYPSGGIPELIRHEQTGLLTRTPSPESLAEVVQYLLMSPDLRERIIRAGRSEWYMRFQLPAFQRDVCNFLEAAPTREKGIDQSAGRFTPRLQSLEKTIARESRDHEGARLLQGPSVSCVNDRSAKL